MSDMGAAPASLRRTCRVACAAVLAIAAVVFVGGWVGGRAELRNIVPGTVGMKWQTAIGLGWAAGALLLQLGVPTRGRRLAAHGLASATGALGLAVLTEYVLGWDLGIDELLFRDEHGRAMGIAYPGRFAPTTAICFVLVAAALLAIDRPVARGWWLSELLAVPAGVVGAMTLVGYLYEIPVFYGPASAAKMALTTGVCFLLLALGVLLARPRGRLVTLATTDDPGGIMMRRMLPVAVLLPLLLGWLRLRLDEAGVFGTRVGTWWLAACTAAAFALLVTRVASRLSEYALEGRRLREQLTQLANHDQLTGLFNRHRFDEELGRAGAHARRYDSASYGLLVIDLDNLKTVNDVHGHPVGDALLQAVAGAFRGSLRATDVAARVGGDEFCVLLPGADRRGAERVAEKLRAAVAGCRVTSPAGLVTSTASVGVAVLDARTGVQARPLAEADAAMYAAKRAGGDGVRSAWPGTPAGPGAVTA